LSIAACLAVSAMNLDHTAVIKKGVPALERGRLSHVAQNYLGAEAYARANAPLIAAQADIGFAAALGGGLLARSTGCASWYRGRRSMPAPTASTSAPNAG
jgi:hypothetical protein